MIDIESEKLIPIPDVPKYTPGAGRSYGRRTFADTRFA